MAFMGLWPASVWAQDAAVKPGALPAVGGPGGAFMLQFALGFIVVIGAILLLAWMMKRVQGFQGGAQGRLRILGGISLGTRERAVLIQVGDEQVLLGVAPGRVSRLHVLAEPLPVDSPRGGEAAGFAERLKTALGRRAVS
jgi:flagellar protein FliO/FliZ